jgi:hypothetical protein
MTLTLAMHESGAEPATNLSDFPRIDLKPHNKGNPVKTNYQPQPKGWKCYSKAVNRVLAEYPHAAGN